MESCDPNQMHLLFTGHVTDNFEIYVLLWCSKSDVIDTNSSPSFIDGTLSSYTCRWLNTTFCASSETYFAFNGSTVKRFKNLRDACDFIDDIWGGFVGKRDTLQFNFTTFIINLLVEALKKTWYIGTCNNDDKRYIIFSNTKNVTWVLPNCEKPIIFKNEELTYEEGANLIEKMVASCNM